MPEYANSDVNGVQYPVFGQNTPPTYGASTGRGGMTFTSGNNPQLLDTAGTTRLGVTTSGADITGDGTVSGNLTVTGTISSTGGPLGTVRAVTGTITSAAAGTAVNLVPDASVPAGKKCYVVGFFAKVNGATLWATTTSVKIQDTNGSAVDFATMAVAALTGNAFVGPYTSNITVENAMALGTGGTTAKGIQIKGNANGTGSDLVVTVLYYIA